MTKKNSAVLAGKYSELVHVTFSINKRITLDPRAVYSSLTLPVVLRFKIYVS